MKIHTLSNRPSQSNIAYVKEFIDIALTADIPNVCLEELLHRASQTHDLEKAIAAAKMIELYAYGLCHLYIDPYSEGGISCERLFVS